MRNVGELVIMHPFQRGTPCSSCQTPNDFCVDGLCANTDRGDVADPSSTASLHSTDTMKATSSSVVTNVATTHGHQRLWGPVVLCVNLFFIICKDGQ